MFKFKTIFLFVCTTVLMLSSCASYKKTLYMQDVTEGEINTINKIAETTINVDDKLSIVVTCSNPEAAIPFNTPMLGIGSSSMSSQNSENVATGYIVNDRGEIRFPELGIIDVKGMTRQELTIYLEDALLNKLNDVVVTVQYMNFKVSVLGDVKNPGVINVKSGRITLLEALTDAGDLSLLARRKTVLVVREREGERSFERIDLTSKSLFESDYYYLQQNDLIYVEPSRSRILSSKMGAWLPYVLSIITTVTAIIALTV